MLTNGTSDAVACSTGVPATPMPGLHASAARTRRLDVESQAWIDRLSAAGRERDAGIDALHALLLKAARFEVDRRRAAFPHLRGNDYDDTRGALYKTIHDARRKLRAALADRELGAGGHTEAQTS